MKKLLIVGLWLTCHATMAQSHTEGETELAGFILGQYRKTVHTQLGAPIEKRKTGEGWVYEFHAINADTSVYALFKYAPWDTTRIHAIQLTGDAHDDMKPFRGVKLGDKRESLRGIFGAPSRMDSTEEPAVTTLYYDHHNYSFDIDQKTNRIYGIQIYGNILEQKPRQPLPTITGFQRAVLSMNKDSIIAHISPDAYFYRGGKVISYSVSARKEFSNAQSEFVRLILGETGSLHYLFDKEKQAPVEEKRIYNNRNDVTTVFKFPDSKVVKEIIFLPHAGKWKVYEVKFH